MLTWSTACLDWRERIVEGRSLIPFEPLFPEQVTAAREVFDGLHIVDAPRSPTMAESSRPWVTEFASAIFGSYEHDTGRRLIRDYLLLISKKNSKSTTAAAIMLTALLRNWRHSAEFLIVAPTLEVANNSFFPARDMIRANPRLSSVLHVQEHLKTITYKGTGAILKVVAADNDTVSGKKATGVLIDELWLFGKKAGAENMLREATGGLVSRPEGFTIYLSTQSDEPPAGVFKQKLQYFRDVRDGKIEDKRSLPVIYEFPERMVANKDYLEPKYFRITNPNLGLSVDQEWLEDELKKAQNAGQQSLRGFVAKHLNVEMGLALGSDNWSGAEFWEAAADAELADLEALLARCEVATVGIDGGGNDDLFGLAIIGRERETRHWLAWCHTWCNTIVLTRRKDIASQLHDFETLGELTIYDKPGDDVDDIVAIIKKVDEAGLLYQVGLDRAGIGAIVDALAKVNIGGEDAIMPGEKNRVGAVPQGFPLMTAIHAVERKLAAGEFKHGGQAIMNWSAGNARVEAKNNYIMITKQLSGHAKIDPLMAIFDAAYLMGNNPEPMGGSIFDHADFWSSDESPAKAILPAPL